MMDGDQGNVATWRRGGRAQISVASSMRARPIQMDVCVAVHVTTVVLLLRGVSHVHTQLLGSLYCVCMLMCCATVFLIVPFHYTLQASALQWLKQHPCSTGSVHTWHPSTISHFSSTRVYIHTHH